LLGSFVITAAASHVGIAAFFSTSRLMAVPFPAGDYPGTNFFTSGDEGIQSREFEFEHLPHARLTDEDDENEKW
jgi:hypothetical protein